MADSKTYLQFLKEIEKLAQDNSSAILSNSSPEQANAIMTTFFNYSHDCVRIFAKNMDGTVSENRNSEGAYFDAVDNFLSHANTKLRVVLEETPKPESKIFKRLMDENSKGPDKVEVRIASEEFKMAIQNLRPSTQGDGYNPELIHFATADNKMFRVEYNLKSHQANFSFNKSNIVNILNNIFDTHYAGSEKISAV